MGKLRFRQKQLLISAIGAALILPSDLFLGVMFTFSFRTMKALKCARRGGLLSQNAQM